MCPPFMIDLRADSAQLHCPNRGAVLVRVTFVRSNIIFCKNSAYPTRFVHARLPGHSHSVGCKDGMHTARSLIGPNRGIVQEDPHGMGRRWSRGAPHETPDD